MVYHRDGVMYAAPLPRSMLNFDSCNLEQDIFNCTDQLRDVFSLPPRYGGLGIPIMPEVSEQEYEFSQRATAPLNEAILNQACEYNEPRGHGKAA